MSKQSDVEKVRSFLARAIKAEDGGNGRVLQMPETVNAAALRILWLAEDASYDWSDLFKAVGGMEAVIAS